MRVWPDTLAGRTALAVAAGMVLTFGITLTVFWLWKESGRGGEFPLLIKRIAVTAAAVDRAEPDSRAAMALANGGKGVTFQWPDVSDPRPSPRRGPSPGGFGGPGWMPSDRWGDWRQSGPESPMVEQRQGGRLTSALRRALAEEGMVDIHVWPMAPDPRNQALRLRIRLRDGSWLRVRIERGRGTETGLWRYLVALTVFAVASAALSLWVARRVTAPLDRLATAADTLGSGGEGTPLPETGPAEVRHAAAAFNRMQGRIRRFTHDRTVMLAAISHDLRTVLTRLTLRAEFIADPTQQQKAVADLEEMQAMLDATMSFAREDAADESVTGLDLSSLLESLCDGLMDSGAKITFEGPQRAPFSGRPVALKRAFGNLLGNAVKYGGETGVTLIAGSGELRVTIADRGPGIAPEYHEKVFSPFFRVEGSRSRETGGTGLGMTVARDIVRAHGGEVSLADREGGGLLVMVTLPVPGPA
ncbi:MAG: ATP-binding protein [Nitrospirota bacterium]|nr:ATP-binding protein [Nitrospirota bacterium]